MKYIFFLIAFGCSLLFADVNQNLFKEAVDAYTNKKYKKALNLFLEIKNNGVENSDLYYNIGNCYYRTGKLGRAILYVKKSLKLNPKNKVSSEKLKFLMMQTKDKQEIKNLSFPEKIFKELNIFFSFNLLAVLMIISFVAITVLLSFSFLNFFNNKVVINFFVVFLLFVFFMLSGFSLVKWHNLSSNKEAVIINDSVVGFSGPSSEFTRVFTVHKGMIINLIKNENGWFHIQLPNGISGWIPNETFLNVD